MKIISQNKKAHHDYFLLDTYEAGIGVRSTGACLDGVGQCVVLVLVGAGKELFKYLDGEWTLDFAIEKIKRNSRVYARKQMTWFKRDTDIRWFHPDEKEAILCYLDATLNTRL